MDDTTERGVRSSYDRVAREYTIRIAEELKDKPLDRALLDRFAANVGSAGPVCELGCGPGHVARHLAGQGLAVVGLDLSPAMVEEARNLNPGLEFRVGDLRSLDAQDAPWAGLVAFYSLIHIPRDEVVDALHGLKRSLKPGGWLLIAFHIGEETVHLEEWWGERVSIDFIFFRPDEMAGYLEAAGFAVEEIIEREPYSGVEHPSRRAYLFARKPLGPPEP